jgi:hypothetical protein
MLQVAPVVPEESCRQDSTRGNQSSSKQKWAPNHALALARLNQDLSSDLDQLVPIARRGNNNKYARNLRVLKVRKRIHSLITLSTRMCPVPSAYQQH